MCVSVIEHPTDRRFEKNRGTGVLPPVGGAVAIAVQSLAGHGRVQRDGRRARSQRVERFVEVRFDGVHVMGVVGHFPIEKTVEDLKLVELSGDVVEDVTVAGDGDC